MGPNRDAASYDFTASTQRFSSNNWRASWNRGRYLSGDLLTESCHNASGLDQTWLRLYVSTLHKISTVAPMPTISVNFTRRSASQQISTSPRNGRYMRCSARTSLMGMKDEVGAISSRNMNTPKDASGQRLR